MVLVLTGVQKSILPYNSIPYFFANVKWFFYFFGKIVERGTVMLRDSIKADKCCTAANAVLSLIFYLGL